MKFFNIHKVLKIDPIDKFQALILATNKTISISIFSVNYNIYFCVFRPMTIILVLS